MASASRDNDSKVTCAVDLVVQREIATAAKANRNAMTPDMVSRIHNELCLFLFAGAMTTADTLTWGLKELSLRQDFSEEDPRSRERRTPEDVRRGKAAAG